MSKGPRYRVPLRRRREQKTDFRLRLALLKSGKPRLVLRKSSNNMHAQLVEFNPKGDKVLFEATAIELKKQGWKGHTGNTASAYLTGYLLGKKAGEKEAVVDFGLQYPHSRRLMAAVKGAIDAGMKIKASGLPDDSIKTDEMKKLVSAMKV